LRKPSQRAAGIRQTVMTFDLLNDSFEDTQGAALDNADLPCVAPAGQEHVEWINI
jgi:hypothetical protein